MKLKVTDAATLVLVVFALAMTALVVRRELMPRPSPQAGVRSSRQADWQTYTTAGRLIGSENAPVTIIAFSDFECPYCRELATALDSLHRAQPGRFKVIYRHFPLPNHRFARPAARASECAAEQGHFPEMHNALFLHADSLGLSSWWWYARQAGVADSLSFHNCLRKETLDVAIDRDLEAGRTLGLTGTPTILIQDLRISGMPAIDSLAAFIRRAETSMGRPQ